MEVILARHSGFCEGVARAYKIAMKTLESGKPVYILGLLVHNSKVIDKLEEAGAKTIHDLSEVKDLSSGAILISAHGVSPKVYDELKKTNLKVIDTTCPWVKRPQRLAKKLSEEGYHVIIVGDKDHTEVAGIMGWTNYTAQVIESIKDLEAVEFHKKIGVVAQTTQSQENFDNIVSHLKNKSEELKAFNTICASTEKMQKGAIELAKKVDLMLVIGDKKSANTKRLTELCANTGTPTYQIEGVEALSLSWFKGKNKIGVTAGASTGDFLIDEVLEKIRAL